MSLASARRNIVCPPGAILQLVDALRGAPHIPGRLGAAKYLSVLATAQEYYRKRIAEAGTMGVLLTLFVDSGGLFWDKEQMAPAHHLAHMLVRWERAAVHDLQRAITGPDVDLAYISLLVLKVFHCAPGLS